MNAPSLSIEFHITARPDLKKLSADGHHNCKTNIISLYLLDQTWLISSYSLRGKPGQPITNDINHLSDHKYKCYGQSLVLENLRSTFQFIKEKMHPIPI